MKHYDYILVGAGLYSAVIAWHAKQAGKSCLVLERRSHIGGNIYCEEIEGINVHKYGAHIFHTSDRKVWEFVNSFVEFNRYTNSPVANYKGEIYNIQEEQRMLTMLTHRGSDTFDSRTLTGDVVSISDVEFLRAAARRVHVSDAIMKYAVDITATSRGAGTKPVQGLSTLVRLGASPRASIALTRIGQANALMQGRDYVIPEDVKAFTHEVLRHRILLTFEALADGVTSDQVVDSIVQAVPVP